MKKFLFVFIFVSVVLWPCFVFGYEIDGFTKDIYGEFYDDFSSQHKNKLIQASIKEKLPAGNTYPIDIIYKHAYLFIRKDGSIEEYDDYAMKINAPLIKNQLGEQKFSYDTTRQKIEILKASVYDSEGKEIETDVGQIKEKDIYADLIYSELKMKILSMKGLEDGYAIRIAKKEVYTPEEDKGFITAGIDLDYALPIREMIYICRIEAGTPASVWERFRGKIPELQTKRIVLTSGDVVYIYKLTNKEAVTNEYSGIPSQEYSDRVFIYKPVLWEEISSWYYKLSKDKWTADNSIEAKVKELTKGLSQREDKIKAIYDYIRKIRYVSILLNMHRMTPHPAAETFRNMYGDCKDKSVLLITMLKCAGIDSELALVNTDYLIEKKMTTPLIFNHAIVAISAADGKYKFLDPTAENIPYGVLPEYLQFRNALIVRESHGELVLIPNDNFDKHSIKELIQISFKNVKDVEITEQTIFKGKQEITALLNNLPEDKLKTLVQQDYAKKNKEIKINTMKFEKTGKENEESFHVDLMMYSFSKQMGDLYSFIPLEETSLTMDGAMVSSNQRKTDIEIKNQENTECSIEINMPEKTIIEFVPNNLNLKNDKFGQYDYTIKKTDKTISIHRKFLLTAKRITSKDYAEFKDFYKKCMEQESQSILFKNLTIADFNKAIELNSKNAEAYINRGIAYNKIGNYNQAIVDYDKAIELDPKNAEAYNNRGTSYTKLGQHQQALEDYSKAIELNPKNAITYRGRGLVYYNLGNYKQAIADFDKAIELNPKFAEAYYGRGLIYGKLDNPNQAIADFDKAIESNSKYAWAYNNRGFANSSLGNWNQAIADYDKAIELDQKNELAYVNRGNAYGNLGNYNLVIVDFNKVLELNPKSAFAYYKRGIAYDKLGKNEQAIADFKKAASLDSKDAQDYLKKKRIAW